MELAGSYIDLMAGPVKERADYPMRGFTTEYSGPVDERSVPRFETIGDVRSAAVPRNSRAANFASPGSKGSGFANVNTRRQF